MDRADLPAEPAALHTSAIEGVVGLLVDQAIVRRSPSGVLTPEQFNEAVLEVDAALQTAYPGPPAPADGGPQAPPPEDPSGYWTRGNRHTRIASRVSEAMQSYRQFERVVEAPEIVFQTGARLRGRGPRRRVTPVRRRRPRVANKSPGRSPDDPPEPEPHRVVLGGRR